MNENIVVKKIDDIVELIDIAPLIKKFFDTTQTDVTEDEFWNEIYTRIKNDTGAVFYVKENDRAVAYCAVVATEQLGKKVAFVWQGGSEKPFYLRKLKEPGDKWCLEHGMDLQIFLVRPEMENYTKLHLGAKTKYIYMVRDLEKPVEVETQEAVPVTTGE